MAALHRGPKDAGVGRKELEVALGMLRAAEAGRGGILLVEGEPGIGKSRFLEESAARGHGAGASR